MSPKALAFSGSGTGASNDPYIITTCAQWLENSGTFYYKLGDDIDCTGVTYTPIGDNPAVPTTVHVDGAGFTISNVAVNYSGISKPAGLFGNINGEVANLGIADSTIEGESEVGALAGKATNATFTNIRATGVTVEGVLTDVGGLVGELNDSSLDQSSFNGSVTANNVLGGLVGRVAGASPISNSFSAGTISPGSDAGGLVGVAAFSGSGAPSFTNVYTAIEFTSVGAVNGGLIGTTDNNVTVTNAFSAADMRAGTGFLTGAVFGHHFGTATNVYFDQTRADKSNCRGNGGVPGCTAVNTTGTDPGYFLNNSSSPPLNTWVFGGLNPWRMTTGYPNLRPMIAPTMMCAQPTRTATSVTAHCMSTPDGWGTTTWTADYQVVGASTWTPIVLDDVHDATVTVSNLEPNTTYRVRFQFTNDAGANPYGFQDITTLASTDRDGDGTLDTIENAAPNDGDADNDGIKDVMQANVTSYLNPVTNKYATLAVNQASGCRVSSVSSTAEPSTNSDTAYEFPLGLMNFNLNCNTPGAIATVTQYFSESSTQSGIVRKFNPTNQTYATITGAVVDVMTTDGKAVTKVSYTITDGGSLDMDATANGTIVDPVGLGTSVVLPGVPNTGLQQVSPLSSIVPMLAGFACIFLALVPIDRPRPR